MNLQKDFNKFFSDILSTVKTMEKNSAVFSELQRLSEELETLEKFVGTAFETLDGQFQKYIKQIGLLSDIVEFQRNVLHFKTPAEMNAALSAYLKKHIPFQYGFTYFRVKGDDENAELVRFDDARDDALNNFLEEANLTVINNLVQNRDQALLITDISEFKDAQLPWHLLKASSVIIYPLRVKESHMGFGMLIRTGKGFSLPHLSLINVNLGLVALLFFQYYYFYRLKSRLFKQFKLKKILEEVKYAEYFDKGPLFIFTLDPRGIILHTNAAAVEKIHLDEDTIVGEKFASLLPEKNCKEFSGLINQLQEGDVRFMRTPVISPQGKEFILELYVSKMDLQEKFTLLIVFAIDTTLTFYREKQERLRETMENLSNFSQVITDAFNNLLNILIPNLSLVRAQLPEDHETQKSLEKMETQLERSSGLIQKFLNYDLPVVEKKEAFNLNRSIQKICREYQKKYKDVQIKFALDAGIPIFRIDPNRMERLFRIMIQNSLDAIEEKGEILISSRLFCQKFSGVQGKHNFYLPAGNYAEVIIEDNGRGIDPANFDKIFTPFFSTQIDNEGVGLGLFIAYHIVQKLGGYIYVHSKPNQFTQFFIYLPIQGEKEMHPVASGMEKAAQNKHSAILVVDDEYPIRSMLQEVLEMNGFQVYTAANGKEGVDIFRKFKNQIKLVILDMVMPVMDGRRAFSEIQKISPGQKVFVISGYTVKEDLDEIFSKGLTAFLRKPFQVKDFVNKVKTLLN